MAREDQLPWPTLDEVTRAAKAFLDPGDDRSTSHHDKVHRPQLPVIGSSGRRIARLVRDFKLLKPSSEAPTAVGGAGKSNFGLATCCCGQLPAAESVPPRRPLQLTAAERGPLPLCLQLPAADSGPPATLPPASRSLNQKSRPPTFSCLQLNHDPQRYCHSSRKLNHDHTPHRPAPGSCMQPACPFFDLTAAAIHAHADGPHPALRQGVSPFTTVPCPELHGRPSKPNSRSRLSRDLLQKTSHRERKNSRAANDKRAHCP